MSGHPPYLLLKYFVSVEQCPGHMDNKVIPIERAIQKRIAVETEDRVKKLSAAGLSETDIDILKNAANLAFGPTHCVIDALEMGFENLRQLYVGVSQDKIGDVFDIGVSSNTVLIYTIANQPMTFDWHEEETWSYSLAADGDKHPADRVREIMERAAAEEGLESYSLLGLFALAAFFFSCMTSYHPLNLQHFKNTKRFGLLLHDPERGTDVALVTELTKW